MLIKQKLQEEEDYLRSESEGNSNFSTKLSILDYIVRCWREASFHKQRL